jgi:hypothetical protein
MRAASRRRGAALVFSVPSFAVNPPPAPPRPPASREGLVEVLLVAAVVALAIAGAIAIFGDEIRAALGPPPRPVP